MINDQEHHEIAHYYRQLGKLRSANTDHQSWATANASLVESLDLGLIRRALAKITQVNANGKRLTPQNLRVPEILCRAALADQHVDFIRLWMVEILYVLFVLKQEDAIKTYDGMLARFIREIHRKPEKYSTLVNELGLPTLGLANCYQQIKTLFDRWTGNRVREFNFALPHDYRRLKQLLSAFRMAHFLVQQQSSQPESDTSTQNDEDVDVDLDDAIAWYRASSSSLHIAKREHHLPNDPQFFSKSDILTLASSLRMSAYQGEKAAIILYLSLITGEPVATWIQAANTQRLPESVMDCDSNPGALLLTRVVEMPSKQPLAGHLIDMFIKANDYPLALPVPKHLLDLLVQPRNDQVIWNELMVTEFLKLRTPAIIGKSIPRIERTLYFVIKRHIADRVVADFVVQKHIKHSPAMNYSHFAYQELLLSYQQAVRWIHGEQQAYCEFLTVKYPSTARIGSNTLMKVDQARHFMKTIAESVDQTPDAIICLNRHTVWIWHAILLLTATRVVSDIPGLPDCIDYEDGLWFVSDKENKTSDGIMGRFVPLCPFLVEAIKQYVRHVEHVLRQKSLVHSNLVEYKVAYADRAVPVLVWIASDGKTYCCSSVRHQDILDFLKDTKFAGLPKNWTRHWARRFLLTKQCPSFLVDALFGHEKHYAEFTNPYSSASLIDLEILRGYLQELSKFLHLKQPRLRAI